MPPCPQDEWVLTKGSKRAHFSPESCWRVPWWLLFLCLNFWKIRIRNRNSKYHRFFCSLPLMLLSRCFVFVLTRPPWPPSAVDNSIESLKVMNMGMWQQGGSNEAHLRWLLLVSNRAATRSGYQTSMQFFDTNCVCSTRHKNCYALKVGCKRLRLIVLFFNQIFTDFYI